MTLDEIIDIADDAYPDGMVRAYFDEPDKEHGDGLARFIATEIRETYDEALSDVEQLEEAERVMNTAIHEVQVVQIAFMKAIGAAEEQICPKCHQRRHSMRVSYEAGDLIRYRTFDGAERLVRVTQRHKDIKNGSPGFEATVIYPAPKYGWDADVWGYDSQIIGNPMTVIN